MNRIAYICDVNRLFQVASIFIFKKSFNMHASTMATDKPGQIIINLVGDVMIGVIFKID